MTNTMKMFTANDHYVSFLLNQIDESKYYELRKSQDNSFYWKYKNMGHTNTKAKYWHHNEIPHQLYADELYNFLGENNVTTN